MLEARFGPISRLARELGWENPSFFGSHEMAMSGHYDDGCLDIYTFDDDYDFSRFASYS